MHLRASKIQDLAVEGLAVGPAYNEVPADKKAPFSATMMKLRFTARWFAACLALAFVVSGFTVWAKSQYGQPEAVFVAQAFLSRLQSEDFDGAFALTTKSGLIGKTPADLRAFAQRHTCWNGRFVWTSPPQTNGNRLRRLFQGQQVDMDEIHLEFAGACMLGVRLRRISNKEWRVVYFASHAG